MSSLSVQGRITLIAGCCLLASAATSADNGRELSALADKQQQRVGQFKVSR